MTKEASPTSTQPQPHIRTAIKLQYLPFKIKTITQKSTTAPKDAAVPDKVLCYYTYFLVSNEALD